MCWHQLSACVKGLVSWRIRAQTENSGPPSSGGRRCWRGETLVCCGNALWWADTTKYLTGHYLITQQIYKHWAGTWSLNFTKNLQLTQYIFQIQYCNFFSFIFKNSCVYCIYKIISIGIAVSWWECPGKSDKISGVDNINCMSFILICCTEIFSGEKIFWARSLLLNFFYNLVKVKYKYVHTISLFYFPL